MSDILWRKCQHCGKEKYCTASLMRDHEEDCDQRPSRKAKRPTCPVCSNVLQKVSTNAWICPSDNCTFTVGILPGGKLP